MSTNKINPANVSAQQQLTKFQKVDNQKSDSVKQEKTIGSLSDQSCTGTEKLDISDKAHNIAKLKELMEAGRIALAEEPPIREDKVAEVRQKLADGFYQTADVKQEVVTELTALMSKMDHLLK
jgi:anti-sigma28 factor (negative regulator of flagellin synthesis)